MIRTAKQIHYAQHVEKRRKIHVNF